MSNPVPEWALVDISGKNVGEIRRDINRVVRGGGIGYEVQFGEHFSNYTPEVRARVQILLVQISQSVNRGSIASFSGIGTGTKISNVKKADFYNWIVGKLG